MTAFVPRQIFKAVSQDMPIIEMHLLTGRTVDQKRRVAKAVANAVASELDVDLQAVRILITEHGAEEFSVGGVTAGAKAQLNKQEAP